MIRSFPFLYLVLATVLLFLAVSCHTEKEIVMLEADNGKSLHLRVGDTVTVILPCYKDDQCDWYSVRGAADMRIVAERMFYRTNDEIRNQYGGDGIRVFVYRLIGPGKCGVSLEYRKIASLKDTPLKKYQLLLFATGKAEEAAADPADWLNDEVKTMTDSKGNVVPMKE